MAIRVGINGFGRIGTPVLRAALEQGGDIEFVAVNDLTDSEDTRSPVQVRLRRTAVPGDVEAEGGRASSSTASASPCLRRARIRPQLPWDELGVDIVIESTGRFTERDEAGKHLQAGAKKVIISAPAKDEDVTIVLGVNEDVRPDQARRSSPTPLHHQLPGAVAKVLHDNFGIERA